MACSKQTVVGHAGSEEMLELTCQPCSYGGEYLPVEGYCITCEEYLCITCYKIHCNVKPCRYHKLLNKSKMHSKDAYTEPCSLHEGELFDFFCETHQQLICHCCKEIGHRHCDVNSIMDMVENIEECSEYNELNMELKRVAECFTRTRTLSKKHEKEIGIYYAAAKEILKKLRDEDLGPMQFLSETCSERLTDIELMSSAIRQLHDKKQYRKLIFMMKKSKGALSTLNETLAELNTANDINRYRLVPKEELSNEDRLTSFGHVPIFPEKLREISLNYTINGFIMLPDNKLAIAENSQTRVVIFDTQQKTSICKIKTPATPMDITMVNSTKVAVTLPYKKQIQCIIVSKAGLSLSDNIAVTGNCHGIAYDSDRFIVTFKDPCKIEIIAMDGTVLKGLVSGSDAQLLKSPTSIAINVQRTAVYVSDSTNKTVTLLSLEGGVETVYKEGLTSPNSLVVDKAGIVYVCDNSAVYKLLPDCTKFQKLLECSNPSRITYCDKDDKLYIWRSNYQRFYTYQVK